MKGLELQCCGIVRHCFLALIDCTQQYINAMSNFILIKVVMFFLFRTLTADQKALIMAYAELDKEVNGSVEGIVKTNKGRKFIVDLHVRVCNT